MRGYLLLRFRDFIFLLFVFLFASGDNRSFMGGSDVVHCVRFCDWPASWLELGAWGNAGDLYIGHYCYIVTHCVGNVGPLPL